MRDEAQPRSAGGGAGVRATAGASALAVLSGLVGAFSLPPWGWWPLGFAGVAGLGLLLAGRPALARAALAGAHGIGFFAVGLWWMGEFSAPGAGAVVVLETLFVAAAAVATPAGRWGAVALPGALVLAEAARGATPFGGLPMAGLALGQADGPLAGAARVGGPLLVLALVATVGVGLAAAVGRRWTVAAAAAGLVLATAAGGVVAPDGGAGTAMRAAVVQGGGARGFRAVDGDSDQVLARHRAATAAVRPPVAVVVWPEDVIDVEGPIAGTDEGAQVAALARELGATLVAGVVEGAGPERFRNAALAWGPDGAVVDRFEKVHRVPFGEYVPGRRFFDRIADLSDIPRDAIPGRGPGLLRTPAGDFGVLVSYEVFFAGRAREATRAGGRLVLVPTNAASYSTSQVPAQQLATARLRAIETGRDVLQAAPTGYSAVIDHRGHVRQRSTLGARQVLHTTAALRSGRTLYVRGGDGPILGVAASAVAWAWVAQRRRRRQA